ncbi:MAG: GerMN domain-containing protein [Thermodesulfovibrionales bacterium]
MNNSRIVAWTVATVLLLGLSAVGGYYFFHNFTITKQKKSPPQAESQEPTDGQQVDAVTIRLHYPVGGRLEVAEKSIPRRLRTSSVAEAVIEEYFKLPVNGADSIIPAHVKLLGLYRDAMQILYIDLSDELRRNFHADALSEYLLLKGLYETVVSNISDIQDVKVLVEGKEIETLGGHVLLRYPLKTTVSSEVRAEVTISDEQ